MEILIDPDKAAGALALVASAAREKSPLAYLAGLTLRTEGESLLKASASDNEVSVTAALSVQVRAPGSVRVNARSLLEVLRRAEGRALAVKTGAGGRVDCALGRSRYQLGTIPEDESPSLSPAGKPVLEMPAAALGPLIADVKSAAGPDGGRHVLASVLLERRGPAFSAVATDGRRLAWREAALPEAGKDFSFPVPSAAVRALERAFALAEEGAAAQVLFDGGKMSFRVGNLEVSARALEGVYPVWREAVPPEGQAHFFSVSADKLSGALEGLVRVVPDPAEIVLERHSESALRLTTEGRLNAGEEIVETSEPAPNFPRVRVNGRYFLDAVAPALGKLVRLGVLAADRPLLVRSMDQKSYRAVLMPIIAPAEEARGGALAGAR